jgi:PKD repeat protein
MSKKIVVPILCIAFLAGMLSGCVEQEEEAENNAPVADFGYTIEEKTATFTDESTDEDDDTLTYSWDFGDDETSAESSPIHTYAENGTYTVTLTVSDGTDEDTKTEVILIGNIAPVADFSYEATNLTVVFTDASTDQNGDDTLTNWAWDFNGDESIDNETQGPITWVYAAAGTYNATLTVTDDYGLTNSVTMEITVSAEAEE